MSQNQPIPENEDYLFLDYIRGCNTIALAHASNLTIDQFTNWANSDETRTRVEAFTTATKLRTKALLAASQLDIINALLQMALAPPPQTDDPKVIAAALETARKAASLLFRAAQKQDATDNPNTPQAPQDPDDHPDNDPDDDPETDPDGDSNIGPGNSLKINPNETNLDTADEQLPSLKGSSLIAELPPPGGPSVDDHSQNDPGGGEGVGPTTAHTRGVRPQTKRSLNQNRGTHPARHSRPHTEHKHRAIHDSNERRHPRSVRFSSTPKTHSHALATPFSTSNRSPPPETTSKMTPYERSLLQKREAPFSLW